MCENIQQLLYKDSVYFHKNKLKFVSHNFNNLFIYIFDWSTERVWIKK